MKYCVTMYASRFERMVAIPEQDYQYLKNLQQTSHPSQSRIASLTSDYSRQGNIQDPYVRIHRQGETLDALKKLKDEMRQRVIQSTPKPYQSRAENLIRNIESQIQVNDRGEILDANEIPIEDSNITDLIQHAVRDRRRDIQPKGWQYFKERLRDINVPHSVLNYDTLNEMKKPLRIKQSPESFGKENKESELSSKRKVSPVKESPVKRKRKPTARYIENKQYF